MERELFHLPCLMQPPQAVHQARVLADSRAGLRVAPKGLDSKSAFLSTATMVLGLHPYTTPSLTEVMRSRDKMQ